MSYFEKDKLRASKKAVRMCIGCRNRFLQIVLLRLSCNEGQINFFSGSGRSFYLCCECLKQPKIEDKIAKIKKLNAQNKNQIKEIVVLWESQLKNLPQN